MLEQSYSVHSLMDKDIPLIMKLYNDVYPDKEQPTKKYWQWCFKAPFGYIAVGIYGMDGLIGYYAALLTKKSAIYYSAMIHPKYRGHGYFGQLADNLHVIVGSLRDYGFLFSNKDIYKIHMLREGFISTGVITEYRKKVSKKPQAIQEWFYADDPAWRWQKPGAEYHIFKKTDNYAVFSCYEDTLQIVGFKDCNQDLLDLAEYVAQEQGMKYITLWCEHDVPGYKKHFIETSLMFKKYKDCKFHSKLRMGQSDVF